MVSFFVSLSLLVSIFFWSVIRFSFLSASLFLSPLPLLFICSLYFSALCIPPRFVCRLLAVRFLWYLPAHPPPPPLPPLVAFAIFVFLLLWSPSASFLCFLSDSSTLVVVLVLSLSLARARFPSRVFSPYLVTLFRVASLFGSLSFVVFSSYAQAAFSMHRRGGGSPVLFVFCNLERGTPMFVSSNLRGVLLFFRFAFGVFFAIWSSTCFVYCSSVPYLLPCSEFFFIVVRCISACWLPLLFFFSRCTVHSCLSFYLEFISFFGALPCLLPASLLSVALTSALLRLPVLSFVAVGSGILSYTLSSPFFAAMALPYASSRFPVSLACSVLLPLSLGILLLVLSFCLCVFFFSPVGLLCLGFRYPSSLVGCSEDSWPPVDVLFGSWLRLFVSFSSFSVSSGGSASLFQHFRVFPRVLLGPCVVTCVSLLLVPPPFGSFALAGGFATSLTSSLWLLLLLSYLLRFP